MDPRGLILVPGSSPLEEFESKGGGKALGLARVSALGVRVPPFVCLSTRVLDAFVELHGVRSVQPGDWDLILQKPIPHSSRDALEAALVRAGLSDCWLAVRSSGLDEDGLEHSFAGQFSSFLFQRGMEALELAIKRCWASSCSERALAYRKEKGLALPGDRPPAMGVVIQKMVACEKAGVAFSRNPVRPLDRDHLVLSSVWGLGEGLVSGELDADHFEIHRESRKVTSSQVAKKTEHFVQSAQGGVSRIALDPKVGLEPSLSHAEAAEVGALALFLEEQLGMPQDCEWGYEGGTLYCLQSRPITHLPPQAFFDPAINGAQATLWDNSNIIESYSGVTSPLTFSFASAAYRQVYIQFCQVMGVPEDLVRARESMFRNMLGLIRGRIYYNLINWYRLVLMLPGAGSNKGFMETMMGVRQQLRPELAGIFDAVKDPVHYALAARLRLLVGTLRRWWSIDRIISDFQEHFERVYSGARAMNFRALSFQQLSALYQEYDEKLLRRWQAPIINDYLCMVFFGLLKKLTEKWLGSGAGSLQNDLLCGQGDLESTEPTKMLMRIAAWIDADPACADLRAWWLARTTPQILEELLGPRSPQPAATARIREFLDRYGFRCINELKLEAHDLHDDPGFVIEAISAYVRRKSYSIEEMERREHAIRASAEAEARRRLALPRRLVYFWVLDQARRAVRNRENLRFARTKIFGVIRHLFRAMGHRLVLMQRLEHEQDVFFLSTDELLGWSEGRSLTLDLKEVVAARKREFAEFEATPPPPDRFTTIGAAGFSVGLPQVLMDADLMRSEPRATDDPNLLYGTPCCPGVVEGVVRVARSAADAQGLDGEILVTERTDPGWVPLYPSCSGLLIERGSLLSHSAVVARELGLPTIVGVSGGLTQKLKTGMRVRIDAAKREIRIL